MARTYQLFLRGYVGGWNFDTDYVNYVLNKYKGKRVDVLVNSLGGDVDTALTIRALFANHGDVHVHFVGMNASAATIAALGAKHVSMDENAFYLIHKCSTLILEWDYLNADELKSHIEQLDKEKRFLEKLDATIANAYARKCAKPQKELLECMTRGEWLTAQEAQEWGFVDEITDYEDDEPPVLDTAAQNFMADNGIPLPQGLERETESLTGALTHFLRNLVQRTHRHDTQQRQAADNNEQQPITHNTMPHTFDNLGRILGCDHFDDNEGNFTLSMEQMQTLEQAAQAEADRNAELQASNDALTARVDELSREPATAPETVITEGNATTADDSPIKVYKAAADLYDILK